MFGYDFLSVAMAPSVQHMGPNSFPLLEAQVHVNKLSKVHVGMYLLV